MKRTLRRIGIVATIAAALVLVTNVAAFAVDPSIDVNPIKGISHTDLGLNNLWVIIGAVLVIFMQAGFALVETGFCRAKNASHVVSARTSPSSASVSWRSSSSASRSCSAASAMRRSADFGAGAPLG